MTAYSAKKIYLTGGPGPVQAWASYMRAHLAEVALSLSAEGVRYEAWYAGRDDGGPYVIGVMDVDDQQASSAVASRWALSVDAVHRAFKKHWDRSRVIALPVDPGRAPSFDGCELLFEARA